MRIFAVTTAIVLLMEAVLVLVFLAGLYWIGNWWSGMLLSIGALLIMLAPWIGDLRVNIDTHAGLTRARLAWWGSIVQRTKPEPQMKICLFGICRTTKPKPSAPKPAEEQKPEGDLMTTMRMLGRWAGWTEANLDPISRTLFAGLNAGNQLLWDAHAFSVMIQGPTEKPLIDGMLVRLMNSRAFGPLRLTLIHGAERRILIDYRISLARAALAGLYAAVQSRPRAIMKAAKVAQRLAQRSKEEAATRESVVTQGPRPRIVMPPEAESKEVQRPRRVA